jgi:hypothetical protein
MMSLATIRRMSDEAAARAQRRKTKPFSFYDEDHVERFFDLLTDERFPNLGSRAPKGWSKVDELFCDHSGFGSPGAPALTLDELRVRIVQHVRDGNRYSYGITEIGQFQLYLGVFVESKAKVAP